MNQITIGRIATRLFPDVGGPSKHALLLSLALNRFGLSNTIVSSKSRRSLRNSAVSYEYLPVFAPAPNGGVLNRLMFSLAFFLFGIAKGLIVFKKRRVSLIHAHSPVLAGLTGLLLSRMLRVPFIYTIHGIPWLKAGQTSLPRNSPQCILELFVISKASGIITIADDYGVYFRKRMRGVPTVTIGNGVDVKRFHPVALSKKLALRREFGLPASPVILVSTTNLFIPEKVAGIENLVESYSRIDSAALSRSLLLIVGGGPHVPKIRGLIGEHNLEDKIMLMGFRNDVDRILQQADVFILNSSHEGSPNALLEGMASGLPCIATDFPGTRAIMGINGILVKKKVPDDLSRALERVILDDSLRRLMGVNSREYAVNSLTWREAAKMTLKFYSLFI